LDSDIISCYVRMLGSRCALKGLQEFMWRIWLTLKMRSERLAGLHVTCVIYAQDARWKACRTSCDVYELRSRYAMKGLHDFIWCIRCCCLIFINVLMFLNNFITPKRQISWRIIQRFSLGSLQKARLTLDGHREIKAKDFAALLTKMLIFYSNRKPGWSLMIKVQADANLVAIE
jgi:hypothetical protein